jgi:hypothetical protein
MPLKTPRRWRRIGCLSLALLAVAAPVPEAAGKVPSHVRRDAAHFDKALIAIGRGLVLVNGKRGVKRASSKFRKAQKRIDGFLADPDVLCAYEALDEALLVLADPAFVPETDFALIKGPADEARDCIVRSTAFRDAHPDGRVYLGRSPTFEKDFDGDYDDRTFVPVGLNGPFHTLRVRASGGDMDVDRLRIYYEEGDRVASQVIEGINALESGHIDYRVLDGRYIESIRVTAANVDPGTDSKTRLKFWGIFFEDAEAAP